jgi:hypothetical protein
MEARLGEQSEVVTRAFLKWTPLRARASRCGVSAIGCPRKLIASERWSSVRMRMTFLGFAPGIRSGTTLVGTGTTAARRAAQARMRQGRRRRMIVEGESGGL